MSESSAIADRIASYLATLDAAAGPPPAVRRLSPIGQVVKSLISSRTRDAVSWAAYDRLGARYGSIAAMADADPAELERLLGPVTFPDDKARYLIGMLAQVRAERPDFDLMFLRDMPIATALAWLERLDGVARKVAASTLNFSKLQRPVFVVDTHVQRVLARLGIIAAKASAQIGSEVVTAAMADWDAAQFARFHGHCKRLGQTMCRWDLPDCAACPLAAGCATARGDRAVGSGWEQPSSLAVSDQPQLF